MAAAAPTTRRAPVLCISHGGGPLPVLGDPVHKSITASLRTRAPRVLSLADAATRPRAILLVTAHWQTPTTTLSSGATHPLLYDYGGFPPESYRFQYPAPGSPAVAAEVRALLAAHGVAADLDPSRGWDHGVFIPLMLIHPPADVPVVQMSILASEDADDHLRLGRALSALRDSNVAIVGSGFASFHNVRHMFALRHPPSPLGPSPDQKAALARILAFNEALVDAVSADDRAARDAALAGWRSLPGAYDAHPPDGADHFMPLLVCAGAALDGERTKMYRDDFVGVPIWSFYWGADDVE